MPDAPENLAAIGLQLRLARATGPDAAAELGHLDAATCEPGQQVLQLRQLDLELTFAGAGVARKNVEDELRAVDNPYVEVALQVTLLRGRELVVEDDHIGRTRRHRAFQLLQLSASN